MEKRITNISIKPALGYDNHVGQLISIMDSVRMYTIGITRNLNTNQLDYRIDKESNTIGSLLMHIGAMEYFTLKQFFSENKYFLTEFEKWIPYTSIIGFYINAISEVRNISKSLLKSKSDSWLMEDLYMTKKIKANKYFKIFHLAQDEASHTGQILYMLKRIPKSEF